MTTEHSFAPGPLRVPEVLAILGRWGLGLLFIYMGFQKALEPVGFLKLVRQYELFSTPGLLNFVASTLPWFEIFCGLLLVLGIAVRGASVALLAMLVPFTVVILRRALEIQTAKGLAFCAIRFDCGCGGGEVLICRKLLENILLIGLSAALIFWRRNRLCLRHTIVR